MSNLSLYLSVCLSVCLSRSLPLSVSVLPSSRITVSFCLCKYLSRCDSYNHLGMRHIISLSTFCRPGRSPKSVCENVRGPGWHAAHLPALSPPFWWNAHSVCNHPKAQPLPASLITAHAGISVYPTKEQDLKPKSLLLSSERDLSLRE